MVKARLASALLALTLVASLTALPACTSSATSSSDAASSAASQAASAGSQASSAASDAPEAADMTVTVTVASPKTDDGFAPLEAAVELSAGSSALDGLKAAAADVVVEDGPYGAFVSSINGLANGSAGAQSGWTYTINGEYVSESAGDRTLADGDTLAWEFYV